MLKLVVLITTFLLNFLFFAPILRPAPEPEFFQYASAEDQNLCASGRKLKKRDGDRGLIQNHNY